MWINVNHLGYSGRGHFVYLAVRVQVIAIPGIVIIPKAVKHIDYSVTFFLINHVVFREINRIQDIAFKNVAMHHIVLAIALESGRIHFGQLGSFVAAGASAQEHCQKKQFDSSLHHISPFPVR